MPSTPSHPAGSDADAGPDRASAPAAAAKPARTGAIWPLLIIGLLLLNVSICAITVTAALRTAPLVEADYYERSLRWTAEDAQWPAPERHGWRVEATAEGTDLVVRIIGSVGTPLDGGPDASQSAFMSIMVATAATTEPLALERESAGVYRASGLFDGVAPGAIELRFISGGGQQARAARNLAAGAR